MTSDTILFLISSCPERCLENVYIDDNPLFDIVVFYYQSIEDKKDSLRAKLKILSRSIAKNFGEIIVKSLIYETEGKGQILQKIDEFLKVNKLYKKYKYVGIFDDDVVCSFSGINEILSIARKYKLDSFQPSLTKDSFFSYEFTLKKNTELIHYVKWVEIMCPIYDSNLFKLSASFFKESISSWGLDCYVFPIISRMNSYSSHAVIDKVSFSHIRKVTSGQIRYSNGLTAGEEKEKLRRLMITYLNKINPSLYIHEEIQSILNF